MIWVGRRVLDATDIANGYAGSFSLDSVSNGTTGWEVAVFSGVDTGSPVRVSVTPVAGGASDTPDPPAISGGTAGDTVVAIFGKMDDRSTTLTAPSNYALATNADWSTTSGTDGSSGIAYRLSGTSSTENPGTFTTGSGGLSTYWYADTLALVPAAASFTGTVVAALTGLVSCAASGTMTPAAPRTGTVSATLTGLVSCAASGTMTTPTMTGAVAALLTGLVSCVASGTMTPSGFTGVVNATMTGLVSGAATGTMTPAEPRSGSASATMTGLVSCVSSGTMTSPEPRTGTVSAALTGFVSCTASGTMTPEPCAGSVSALMTGLVTCAAEGTVQVVFSGVVSTTLYQGGGGGTRLKVWSGSEWVVVSATVYLA